MTKTISERLKAIKAALEYAKIQQNGELKYDYQQPIDYITAIQATLSSAESDEKSVLEKWYANKVMRVEELEPLITTALLAQREKYDALIAKAEGDAGKLAERIIDPRDDRGLLMAMPKNIAVELITTALLKAGQGEWLPIDVEGEAFERALTAASEAYLADYPADKGFSRSIFEATKAALVSYLSPPSSQEGI